MSVMTLVWKFVKMERYSMDEMHVLDRTPSFNFV